MLEVPTGSVPFYKGTLEPNGEPGRIPRTIVHMWPITHCVAWMQYSGSLTLTRCFEQSHRRIVRLSGNFLPPVFPELTVALFTIQGVATFLHEKTVGFSLFAAD